MLFNLTHLNPALVAGFVVSVIIPAVSSLVGRQHWRHLGFRLGLITLALSTLDGFFSQWAATPDGTPFAWRAALGAAATSYLIAVLARLNLWKGTTVDAALLAVGSKPAPAPDLAAS